MQAASIMLQLRGTRTRGMAQSLSKNWPTGNQGTSRISVDARHRQGHRKNHDIGTWVSVCSDTISLSSTSVATCHGHGHCLVFFWGSIQLDQQTVLFFLCYCSNRCGHGHIQSQSLLCHQVRFEKHAAMYVKGTHKESYFMYLFGLPNTGRKSKVYMTPCHDAVHTDKHTT